MKDYTIYSTPIPATNTESTKALSRKIGIFKVDPGDGSRVELSQGNSGTSEGSDNLVFNSNIVYVRGDSNASVSNGYYYAPYRTLDEALAACTRERNTIMILDNATYSGNITLKHGSCENLIAPHAHLNGTISNEEDYATIKVASCNQLILKATAYVFVDDCNDSSMASGNILHGHIGSDLFYRHSPTVCLKANKQLSLTASTPTELRFQDLQMDYPFNLTFLKLEAGKATPVDIPYEFTSTEEYSWVVKLSPTETCEAIAMARG